MAAQRGAGRGDGPPNFGAPVVSAVVAEGQATPEARMHLGT